MKGPNYKPFLAPIEMRLERLKSVACVDHLCESLGCVMHRDAVQDIANLITLVSVLQRELDGAYGTAEPHREAPED